MDNVMSRFEWWHEFPPKSLKEKPGISFQAPALDSGNLCLRTKQVDIPIITKNPLFFL